MKKNMLGTVGNVMSLLTKELVVANENLEVLSLAGSKGVNLIPRIYAIPSMDISIKCIAKVEEGKVFLFGLTSEREEGMIEVTINLPIKVMPPSPEQIAIIEKSIATGNPGNHGSTMFIPD